jgi:hypothetical protein
LGIAALRHVARVLERLPGDLEEHAVLGIEQRGVARREAEEASIELVDVVEQHRRLDEVRIGHHLVRDAERPQVLFAQFAACIAPFAQQAPVGAEVRRARQAG